MKNKKTFMWLLLSLLVLTGCGSSRPVQTEEIENTESGKIVVGFSQLGAESDWRSANTESMKEAFGEDTDYSLVFNDGQQKQTNQITAIRTFIQQDVDYIVLAPVTESGWDSVLEEAKEAQIPVILVDRMVDVADRSLYQCWIGSDFELEGKKVCEWLYQYTVVHDIPSENLHIVDLQGTLGSTAQLGRSRGLNEAALEHGWDIVALRDADFTQEKGREVMTELLREYDNINVVYCENDNEAIGAIKAIEAAGYKAGADIENGEIMVLSFDGINREALSYAALGKIACIGECNPLHGPRVEAMIKALEEGRIPEKFNYVEESIFSTLTDVETVTVDDIEYTVVNPLK
ncbi:simple sugar transport system substrate-binding protein [Pseudobutyrivibrio sp. OR37]|uniref:ABC transporter substrate-binding protein n=1 Tax=Pseudobutyrivibrio sp. OR37 TaxID=1798186 RepID=UPI0008E95A6E|nr:ABC transporter substrate-binding protein [Pseudobutyrivibrio sp. OR37]SFH85813.1 simple sugar transport system substrate-binding protein [Pseudobutyrivibrio sp. OR37]